MKALASGMAIALLLACVSPLAPPTFAAAVESLDGQVEGPIDGSIDGPGDDNARLVLASLTEGEAHEARTARGKIALRDRKLRIRNLLCGTLDLKLLGPFVLGDHWAKASGSQRKAFMDAFADSIVGHSLIIFRAYQGETFKVIAVVPNAKDPKVIAVEVDIRQSTAPLLAAVSGRIRTDWGDFKIIDVVGGGVSTALTLRKEYQDLIEKSDGDVDRLIQLLRKSAASTGKNDNPAAGCSSGVTL